MSHLKQEENQHNDKCIDLIILLNYAKLRNRYGIYLEAEFAMIRDMNASTANRNSILSLYLNSSMIQRNNSILIIITSS